MRVNSQGLQQRMEGENQYNITDDFTFRQRTQRSRTFEMTTRRTATPDRVALCVVLVVTVITVWFSIMNYDLFWHLSNGRAMVQQGRIINEDIFSYTFSGSPFHNHEWLAQIILYLVYEYGGATGLLGFKALASVLAMLMLYATARISGASVLTALALVLMALVASLHRLTVRPQIFSIVLLCLTQLLLYAARAGRIPPRALWVLPVAISVWDTLHGALFGLVFLGAFSTAEFIEQVREKRRAEAPRWERRVLWQVLAATGIILLLSPYGIRSYEAFASLAGGKDMLFSITEEFMPTKLNEFHLFWGMLGASVLLSIVLWRRTSLAHLFAVLPFAVMALRFNRATAAFALVSVPLLAHFTGIALDALRSRRGRALATALPLLAVLLAGGYIVNMKFIPPGDFFAFGSGFNQARLPFAAMRFLQETPLEGNLYNDGRYGGILAWHLYPQKRIFQYNLPAVFGPLFLKIQSRRVLDEYGVTHALVPYDDLWTRMLFPADDPEWIPVFWQSNYEILVRRTPETASVVQRYGLKHYRPGTPVRKLGMLMVPGSPSAQQVVRELSGVLSFAADRSVSDFLGEHAPASGIPDAEGLRLMQDALRMNPSSARLWGAHGAFLYKSGRGELARQSLSRALELDPDLSEARVTLGFIHLKAAQYNQALETFNRALKMKDPGAWAYWGRGLSYEGSGQGAAAIADYEAYLRMQSYGPMAAEARKRIEALSKK